MPTANRQLPTAIFDRKRVRLHRDRAAESLSQSDFLLRELAARMGERLLDVTRRFPVALDCGAHNGLLAGYLPPEAGIETLVQADLSLSMIAGAPGLRVVADEECPPFAANVFDLILSVASLHWVNDLPGALIQLQRSLKPGGMFIAMLPGGETLKELRECLEAAEMRITGGISPRVSPFVDVRDAASLLQRAGFTQPVSDTDTITVWYENPLRLLEDLRQAGQSNALFSSMRHFTRRSLLFAAMEAYEKKFRDDEGRVRATFEIVTMTGWKQDEAPR